MTSSKYVKNVNANTMVTTPSSLDTSQNWGFKMTNTHYTKCHEKWVIPTFHQPKMRQDNTTHTMTKTILFSFTFSTNEIHARSSQTTITCQNKQSTPKSTNFQHASRNSYWTAFQKRKSHSNTPPKMCGDNLHFNQHSSNVRAKITTNKMYEFHESPWKFVLSMLRPTPTDQYKKIRISPQGTKIRNLQQLHTLGQFTHSDHATLETPHTKWDVW